MSDQATTDTDPAIDSNNGEVHAEEPIRQTAPVLPWEISLHSFGTFAQRVPSGGMILKFAPTQQTPQGNAMLTPGIALLFEDARTWESFKEFVASDGKEVKPTILTARTVPTKP